MLCLSISLECEVQYPNYFYIDNPDQNSLDTLKKIQEIEKVKHRNIFANFSAVKDYTRIRVSYPIIDDKNLVQYLRNKPGQLKEAEVGGLIGQLLKGYELLYNKDMYHGNIQPKTLIMEGEVLKLHLLPRTAESKSRLQDFPTDKNYIAPESLETKKYNTTSDIWSIGIITYYMLHGRPPFDIYKTNAYPEEYIVDSSLSLFCMDFLSCCLQRNPKNRTSFKEIKSHPFVTRVKQGWKLVKPNPYLKSKFLFFSECKCNINKLIRGIAKNGIFIAEISDSTTSLITEDDEIELAYKSYIEEEQKRVKFETYSDNAYKYKSYNKDSKICKSSIQYSWC